MVYYDKYMKYKKKYTEANLQQEGGLGVLDRVYIFTKAQFEKYKLLQQRTCRDINCRPGYAFTYDLAPSVYDTASEFNDNE